MDSFAPSSFYLICSPINFRLASFSPCSSPLTPVWPPLPCASCQGIQNLTSDLGAGTAEDGARAVEAALLPLLVAGAGRKVRQGAGQRRGAGLRPLGGCGTLACSRGPEAGPRPGAAGGGGVASVRRAAAARRPGAAGGGGAPRCSLQE